MSLAGMIAQAERSLGLGEPNHIQRWYAARNGSAFNYNFPWCDAAVTYWAVQAGEYAAVCFGKDYAYTVAHAQRFNSAGRWRSGTSGIRRGDIVFFDWGGSRSISRIDHVGIVTSVSGGRIHTIEGNTSDKCLRRVRTASTIAGYGRPAYGSGGSSGGGGGSSSGSKAPAYPLPRGSYFGPRSGPAASVSGYYHRRSNGRTGHDGLYTWQNRMRARGWRITADGLYGPETRTVATAFQREKQLGVDGLIGPETWRAAWTAPIT